MKVVRFLSQVLTWLVILLALGAVAVAVVIPRIAGGTPYTVLTGSMQPKFPPGSLVVVKPIAAKQIQVGDVVTYQLESGKSTVVTHRVTSVGTRLDGTLTFTTQGDANDVADPKDVQAVQIKGRLWYSVPYLGYVNNVFSGRQRQTFVLVASAGLIGYAAFMFVGSIRDRRRKKSPPRDDVRPEVTYQQQDINQYDVQEVSHDHSDRRGPVGGRNAALAVGGLLLFALAFRLIKAHRGRSGERPTN